MTDINQRIEELIRNIYINGCINVSEGHVRIEEKVIITSYADLFKSLLLEILDELPNDIKGIMVPGVPTLHNDIDKISLQDLRILITERLIPILKGK